MEYKNEVRHGSIFQASEITQIKCKVVKYVVSIMILQLCIVILCILCFDTQSENIDRWRYYQRCPVPLRLYFWTRNMNTQLSHIVYVHVKFGSIVYSCPYDNWEIFFFQVAAIHFRTNLSKKANIVLSKWTNVVENSKPGERFCTIPKTKTTAPRY